MIRSRHIKDRLFADSEGGAANVTLVEDYNGLEEHFEEV
jgi:hypothetical protein